MFIIPDTTLENFKNWIKSFLSYDISGNQMVELIVDIKYVKLELAGISLWKTNGSFIWKTVRAISTERYGNCSGFLHMAVFHFD